MKRKIFLVLMATLAAMLLVTGCETDPPDDPPGTGGDEIVAVTDITGVSATGTAGTAITLTGTVAPENATNKTIVWAVASAGTTGATITGNTLNTTAAGTVSVSATITDGVAKDEDYSKNFSIVISAPPPTFVAVTDITGIPNTGKVNTAITLSGTVDPANATNKTIVWSVQAAGAGLTAGPITGSSVTPTAEGTFTVRATIANGAAEGTAFTKDVVVTVAGQWDGWTLLGNVLGTNATRTGTFGQSQWSPYWQFCLHKTGALSSGLGTWNPTGNNPAMASDVRFTAGRVYALEIEFTASRNVSGGFVLQVADAGSSSNGNWPSTELPQPPGGDWWWELTPDITIADGVLTGTTIYHVLEFPIGFTASGTGASNNQINMLLGDRLEDPAPVFTFTKYNLYIKNE